MVDKTIETRLAADWDAGPELNHLAYLALRGKAYKAALKVAARLEALSEKDAGQLDTVAEVHHMNGDTAKAVAISERAVTLATGRLVDDLKKNQERFRRGGRAESPDLKDIRPPSFAIERTPPVVAVSAAGLVSLVSSDLLAVLLR